MAPSPDMPMLVREVRRGGSGRSAPHPTHEPHPSRASPPSSRSSSRAGGRARSRTGLTRAVGQDKFRVRIVTLTVTHSVGQTGGRMVRRTRRTARRMPPIGTTEKPTSGPARDRHTVTMAALPLLRRRQG